MSLKCSGKCGMIFLIVLNILVMLLGLGLLIPGIMVQVDNDVINDNVMPLLNQLSFNGFSLGDAASGLSIALIIAGTFILIVSGLGLFGACCQKKVLLIIYAIIVMVLWCMKVAIVIIWILLRDKVESEIKSQMVSQLDNNYKADDFTTGGTVNNAWNYAFIDLGCCGVNAVTGTTNDFDNTVWQGTSPSAQIPKACCGATFTDYTTFSKTSCTDTVTSGEYFSKGCYTALKDKLDSYSIVFIGVGATILVIEIIAVVAACLICKQAGRNEDKMV